MKTISLSCNIQMDRKCHKNNKNLYRYLKHWFKVNGTTATCGHLITDRKIAKARGMRTFEDTAV